MSNSLDPRTATQDTIQIAPQRMQKLTNFQWRWMICVCVLLGLSGGHRFLRDRQFHSLTRESEKPPFALSEFPKTIGIWQAVDGPDLQLEKEVAQIAGSSDNVIRLYTNSVTGESVSVMILYGLAHQVWPHVPEVCYPTAGYRPISSAQKDVVIRTPDGKVEASFRRQQFGKSKAGVGVVQEVYHSFRNAGHWAPEMGKNWKSFRYHPGMFKVQVQQQIIGPTHDESYTQQLLARIVQEIEERVAEKN